jgi:hypothetical protein
MRKRPTSTSWLKNQGYSREPGPLQIFEKLLVLIFRVVFSHIWYWELMHGTLFVTTPIEQPASVCQKVIHRNGLLGRRELGLWVGKWIPQYDGIRKLGKVLRNRSVEAEDTPINQLKSCKLRSKIRGYPRQNTSRLTAVSSFDMLQIQKMLSGVASGLFGSS